MWEEGKQPRVWIEAVSVPDPALPSSYRPIALTSNVCKVMARAVRDRLLFVLERRGMFSVV